MKKSKKKKKKKKKTDTKQKGNSSTKLDNSGTHCGATLLPI